MSSQQKRILIVEDEKSQRSALAEKFTREGFAVLEADDGQKGLEIALSSHPDLILLDIIMPVMDGMTMLEKLRADTWGKEAKVIILTNLSEVEKISEAVTRGSYNYLVKSDWKLADVVAKVQAVLLG